MRTMFSVKKKTSYSGVIDIGYTGPKMYLDKGGPGINLVQLFNAFRGKHIKITIEETSTVRDQ